MWAPQIKGYAWCSLIDCRKSTRLNRFKSTYEKKKNQPNKPRHTFFHLVASCLENGYCYNLHTEMQPLFCVHEQQMSTDGRRPWWQLARRQTHHILVPKRTKRQTMVYKMLHKNLKTDHMNLNKKINPQNMVSKALRKGK